MAQHHKIFTIFALLLGALLLQPTKARAFDCDFYQRCCLELLAAYEEAGTTAEGLQNMEDVCYLHHALDGMPGAQQLFCLDAWEVMSQASYRHYLSGRIGFYPDSCLADPLADPDEIFEPDPDIPPAPEEGPDYVPPEE